MNFEHEPIPKPLDYDPLNTRIFKLNNGLTIYLSKNELEPRIYTSIAVKAGFKNDPDEATGLAHYLEHMMFKGSDKIGTLDWDKEQNYLEQIEELYEKHRQTDKSQKKKDLYKEIDRLSFEAAKLASPNEYDRILNDLGAKNTNAYTSFDQTVYLNDIPKNELEPWLKVESERFRKLVLRLFHTELETVYEEFNMRNQDSDGIKMFDAIFETLFPGHLYSRQPTIGKAEHLKNPSMRKVVEFFRQYYVPNNMALCLSGDFDVDETIDLIENTFGKLEGAEVPKYEAGKVQKIENPRTEVWGSEAENLALAYRVPAFSHPESLKSEVVNKLLFNQQAGLIDLNLNQAQSVNQAYTALFKLEDHSVQMLGGVPKSGQSLEETEAKLLEQIDYLKNGEFEEWQLEAVINDLYLNQLKQFERNQGRSAAFVTAFTNGIEWEDYIQRIERLRKLSKADVINFVKQWFADEPVVVQKRKGEDPHQISIEKPEITALELDTSAKSQFYRQIEKINTPSIKPQFIDYDNEIQKSDLPGNRKFYYIPNRLNETFKLHLVLNFGTDSSPLYEMAVKYLGFIGTGDLSAQEVRRQFYRLGVKFGVDTKRDEISIYLTGLEKNLSESVSLLVQMLTNPNADDEALYELKMNILKQREDKAQDKSIILREGMLNYVKYGEKNPFTYQYSQEQMMDLKTEELIKAIKNIPALDFETFYYGQLQEEEARNSIDPLINLFEENSLDLPSQKFNENDSDEQKSYFLNYRMVQTELVLMSKAMKFNPAHLGVLEVFNEYFGGGLSSVVYREIREARALAYSAFSYFNIPRYSHESHYMLAYIGTQADKLNIALDSLQNLMKDTAIDEKSFEQAKSAVVKKLQSDRLNGSNIYWNWREMRRRDLDEDMRKVTYEQVKELKISDLLNFFENEVKRRKFNYLLIGDKERLDLSKLKSETSFKELTIDEIFSFEV